MDADGAGKRNAVEDALGPQRHSVFSEVAEAAAGKWGVLTRAELRALVVEARTVTRWGMLRFPPPRPQVLVRATGRRAVPAVDLHVTQDLPDTDRTVRDGVPVTSVERTILDLAGRPEVSDRALESAAAQEERDGWFRRPAQLRTAARSRGRVGAERLRGVLHVGPRLWRSDEEAPAAEALVAAGLPEPVIAHVVATDIGRLEVDLSLLAYRVILEVDGAQHRLTLGAARDADRDAALRRAGWTTLRVPAATVRADPASAARLVRPVLVAGGWR